MTRIIAVAGATGAQGGGLARAILDEADSGFAVRALTRDPNSDAARALAERGAEVVAADLDDPRSLRAAFEGAHGAFCMTNFWEHFSPEREKAQARNQAEAARAAGVGHVVWSTLEDTRERVPLSDDRMPTLMGEYKVPHFDAKGESDEVFLDLTPATCLRTSFYWDNLIHFGMGPKRENGTVHFSLPLGDARLPGMAAGDIGRCVLGVFREGESLIGQKIGVAGGHPTGLEMAAALTDALGEEVVYRAVPFEVYRGLGFPGAEDLGNMFQYKHDFEEEYCATRPIDRSRELNPRLQTFPEWASANADRIPIGG
ncbi:MAG TPA: NmrA/HSCARG family protein [Longimicrobiales bacterium]|nr:NmrA/HSCARG family protein [Longimicrobiales bacterium]